MNNLVWNVIYIPSNGKDSDTVNIFNHGRFRESLRKDAAKCATKDEFEKALHRNLLYYFWGKSEWESHVTPLFLVEESQKIKIDPYWQVNLNWDVFVDYVWNERKKL